MYVKTCTKEISVTWFKWCKASVFLVGVSVPVQPSQVMFLEEGLLRSSGILFLQLFLFLGEGWCSQCKCGAFLRLLPSCSCTVWNTWPWRSSCVVHSLWVDLNDPPVEVFTPLCNPLSLRDFLSLLLSLSPLLKSSFWENQVVIMWVVAIWRGPHNKELMSPAKVQWCPESYQ